MRGLSFLVLLACVGCSGFDSTNVSSESLCKKQDSAEIEAQFVQSTITGHNRFLVRRKQTDNISGQSMYSETRSYRVQNMGVELTRINDRWDAFELPPGVDHAALAAEISQDFEYIEPDYELRTAEIDDDLIQVADDPYVPKQWGWLKVQGNLAQNLSVGERPSVVAVIDSGVDVNHPDLRANIWRNHEEVLNGRDDDGNGKIDDVNGWDFADNDNGPSPVGSKENHGSHVAGIIGAVVNNGIGIYGQAPRVALMPLRFINSNGSGRTSDAIKAIEYATQKRVAVINASWGGSSFSRSLFEAIEAAGRAGVLFVTAAGNGSANLDSGTWYPASYSNENILTVAATTSSDNLASYSNYGARNVDVAAPGSSIFSTYSKGSYGTMSGTSMASPLVAGVAAHLKSTNSSLGHRTLKSIIMATVRPLSNLKTRTVSGGVVNAYSALRKALEISGDGEGEVDPQPPTCL